MTRITCAINCHAPGGKVARTPPSRCNISNNASPMLQQFRISPFESYRSQENIFITLQQQKTPEILSENTAPKLPLLLLHVCSLNCSLKSIQPFAATCHFASTFKTLSLRSANWGKIKISRVHPQKQICPLCCRFPYASNCHS